MLKNTISNYKKAKEIYNEIDNKFYDIEAGSIENTEFQINQILNRLDDLEKAIKNIELEDLTGTYEDKTIDAVKHNVATIDEALYYWKRFFLGGKYAIGLKDPVMLKYVPGLNLEPHDIDKYGGEKALAKKIIGTLTSDLYVNEYENSIKRIILGTMSQNEFNKIFDVLKHKIIQNKFVSLSQYKKEN